MAKPWEKYASESAPAKPWEKYGSFTPDVSPLESGLRGAAQGASLGFADEALGALSNAAQKWTNPNAALFDTENYARIRDEQRAADQAAQKANPGTFLAGQIGGGAALPVGPLGAGKAALMGGAQAFGSSNAEGAGDLAKDAGAGALLGGAVGAAAPYVSGGLSKLGGMASDALEGAGGMAKSAANAFANRATGTKLGREALDEGLIGFGDNAANILNKTDDAIGSAAPRDAGENIFKVPAAMRGNARLDALEGIKKSVGDRAAKEAEQGFFSDADKMAIATSFLAGPHATATVTTGIVGKNLGATRGASSGAVALDKIGDVLKQTPQSFGRFAAPLQAAQERGALSPTVFVLQQTNPEFRKMLYGDEQD